MTDDMLHFYCLINVLLLNNSRKQTRVDSENILHMKSSVHPVFCEG